MSRKFDDTTSCHLPGAALRACAQDLNVSESQIQIIPIAPSTEHFKSEVLYAGLKGSEQPMHVVKIDTSEPYDPRHEFEALKCAAEILGRDSRPRDWRLGVVHPVGYGVNPKFLVTRYQPGKSPQPTFDAAVLGWRRDRPSEEAKSYCRMIAHWLSAFRDGGVRRDGGLVPADYADRIEHFANQILHSIGAARQMNALLVHVRAYIDQLDEVDRYRMKCSYPTRGDARPKNFLVDAHGLYALDMEGFGYGPMEHDLWCLHHSLEYHGVRSRGAAHRASALWTEFWDEYMSLGNSPTLALFGYVYYLLESMIRWREAVRSGGWKPRIRSAIWIRNRLRWLDRLTGDLDADTAHMRCNI